MKVLARCPCGTPPNIFSSEPCNDYPNNQTYSWSAECRCSTCNFTVQLTKQYKSSEDAVAAIADKWNMHPIIMAHTSIKTSLIHSYKANDSLNDQFKDLAIMKHTRFNEDECWIFDEDILEENHLESLVCPVVIRAKTLSKLIEKASSDTLTECRLILEKTPVTYRENPGMGFSSAIEDRSAKNFKEDIRGQFNNLEDQKQ